MFLAAPTLPLADRRKLGHRRALLALKPFGHRVRLPHRKCEKETCGKPRSRQNSSKGTLGDDVVGPLGRHAEVRAAVADHDQGASARGGMRTFAIASTRAAAVFAQRGTPSLQRSPPRPFEPVGKIGERQLGALQHRSQPPYQNRPKQWSRRRVAVDRSEQRQERRDRTRTPTNRGIELLRAWPAGVQHGVPCSRARTSSLPATPPRCRARPGSANSSRRRSVGSSGAIVPSKSRST